MLLAVPVIALATLGGTIATWWFDQSASLSARLIAGAVIGMVLLATIGFAAALVVGLPLGAVAAVLAAGLPIVALGHSGYRARVVEDVRAATVAAGAAFRSPGRAWIPPGLYWLTLIVLLWIVFSHVMIERDGAILTGYVNNLGDLPFHLQVTSAFAYGHDFPVEDPEYAGATFAYPYLADFVTALLVTLGASFKDAFFLQNLVLGLALVALLHRLTRLLTRDRLAAAIAPVLVLFSGGLGFLTILDDARRGEHGLLAVLGSLSHDTTIMGDGPYRWGNVVTTLLVTQRSLLFGLPVALLALILLWQLVRRPLQADRRATHRIAATAGLLTGCLPLIHAHSYVVVLGTAFFLGLLFRQWREARWTSWAIYVVLAVAMGLPEVAMSTLGSQTSLTAFIAIEPGWDHRDLNIAWFWLLNTGLFIPLAALAIVRYAGRGPGARAMVLFCLAFLPWFVIGNVFRLAPWIWDNNKVLIYAFVGFVPLVALVLARLLRRPGWVRSVGIAALLVLTLAGGIDIWRAISGQTEYVEFDRDGIALASQIRADTPPNAVILHAPTWNVPVYLTGRRSVLGYPGHVWSRGLPYTDREADVRKIYADDPAAASLLAHYGVDYVLVSPLERSSLTVDDNLLGRLQLVAQAGDYRLYEVPR